MCLDVILTARLWSISSRSWIAEEGEIFRKGNKLLGPEEMEGEYDGEELRIEVRVSHQNFCKGFPPVNGFFLSCSKPRWNDLLRAPSWTIYRSRWIRRRSPVQARQSRKSRQSLHRRLTSHVDLRSLPSRRRLKHRRAMQPRVQVWLPRCLRLRDPIHLGAIPDEELCTPFSRSRSIGIA